MVARHERSAALPALHPWLAVLLGPIAGSVLTVLIARLPRGEGVALGLVAAQKATLATRNQRHFEGLGVVLSDPWAAYAKPR